MFLSFAVLVTHGIAGQTCSGNLGENIFEDGDFGSGNSNVVSSDPGIAPGYLYQPHPPPNDGYYTIANYTGYWDLFPGWIKIYDNSPDPFGYMMVVNASYEPGLFYEKEIAGLCENTLYEFSADVINLLATGSDMILPNVSFLLNDETKYSTGDIPEDEQWHTYGFTFTTGPGQDAMKLSLRNNAPGGMGNDLALDNISFRPCGPEALILPEVVADICEDGDPLTIEVTLVGDAYETPYYQWQRSVDGGATWANLPGETGTTFTHTQLSAGDYYYRFLVANGPGNIMNYKCRIISNTKIIHVIPKFTQLTDSICQGLEYEVGNSVYTQTGVYVDTLLNRVGCDSIVTLNLQVVPKPDTYAVPNAIDPTCSYLEDGIFSIGSVVDGNPPLTLYFEDDKVDLNATITGLAAGYYSYAITDRYGCRFEESVTLTSPPVFQVDLGPALEVDLGDPVHLIPETNLPSSQYFWEPYDLINCGDECVELLWPPPYSMFVAVIATSEKGCLAEDSVYVDVRKVRKVYFPNAFSPNGDGLNDVFTVFGAVPNVQKVLNMAIFNRWGEMIYERSNFVPNEPTEGWDGTFHGKTLAPDSFAYVIEILFLDGETERYRGMVTLVK